MKYISTRGQAPALAFDDVLLTGLARDGGLYVPENWPRFSADDIAALKDLSYAETAFQVMQPFVGGVIANAELRAIIDDAYGAFDSAEVAPLKPIGNDEWLLELFHGPTLAFKDLALQFLGRIFDYVLRARGERVTIVGATSGDTGSAAFEACRERDAIEIFMLYPDGRVSNFQRRQMTTVDAPNVHAIAIAGTFDDCQDIVKGMFNDQPFRDRFRLSAVNSINWGRIMAQIVYYFFAAVRLGAPETAVSFAVPTGNFGNVFAGYAAHCMGLPVQRLIVGSNRNDILTRFFHSGAMEIDTVHPTISPSMDIQISSNFERLLFYLYDRDGAAVKDLLEGFRLEGRFAVEPTRLAKALELFDGASFDDDQTHALIGDLFVQCGEIVDPHTAVGIAAERALRGVDGTPVVALATAHPAKFPDAVETAIGTLPMLPTSLALALERPERVTSLDNNLAAVQAHIAATVEVAADECAVR